MKNLSFSPGNHKMASIFGKMKTKTTCAVLIPMLITLLAVPIRAFLERKSDG